MRKAKVSGKFPVKNFKVPGLSEEKRRRIKKAVQKVSAERSAGYINSVNCGRRGVGWPFE